VSYRVATIGDLASDLGAQFPSLPPIDPSWLPPNMVHIPGGGLAPAPSPAPAPPSSSSSSLVVPLVVVGLAGVALGFVLFRR
jgi:hypothetical protein